MNKRIKELAEQAGASIEENTLAFPVVFGEMEDFEKFAELIAAEVINKAEDYGLGTDAVEHLKEYFGVE